MFFQSERSFEIIASFILYIIRLKRRLSGLLIYTCMRNTDKPEQINRFEGIKVSPVMSTIRP